MTVSHLIEQLQSIKEKDLEVVKSTSDGLFDVRSAELVLCTVWEGGSIHEEYYPEFEPEEGEIRRTFLVIR
jgi:hypothetical protein